VDRGPNGIFPVGTSVQQHVQVSKSTNTFFRRLPGFDCTCTLLLTGTLEYLVEFFYEDLNVAIYDLQLGNGFL
jgi:hypothetical protein